MVEFQPIWKMCLSQNSESFPQGYFKRHPKSLHFITGRGTPCFTTYVSHQPHPTPRNTHTSGPWCRCCTTPRCWSWWRSSRCSWRWSRSCRMHRVVGQEQIHILRAKVSHENPKKNLTFHESYWLFNRGLILDPYYVRGLWNNSHITG